MLSNQIATSNIKMKTYQQLWQSLTPLYDAGEAQAIVRTVLDVKYGMTLTDIICGKVNEISADEERKLEEIIIRLQKGEPVQYVLGEADFAGRTFHVEPGVLIPRPETAELCQWIEEDMAGKSTVSSGDSSEDSPEDSSGNSPQATDDAKLILDICTGSGCIAITLGLNIPNSEVTGWDISEDALRIAQGNVEMMKAGNVRIEHQDALALPKAAEAADLIVSNPPYICEKEKADMEKNVLEHEPSLALFTVPSEMSDCWAQRRCYAPPVSRTSRLPQPGKPPMRTIWLRCSGGAFLLKNAPPSSIITATPIQVTSSTN